MTRYTTETIYTPNAKNENEQPISHVEFHRDTYSKWVDVVIKNGDELMASYCLNKRAAAQFKAQITR